MSTAVQILICALVVLSSLIRLFVCRLRSPRIIIHNTIEDINTLLDPHVMSPIETQLQSRALANIRLIQAFSLTNTFVSANSQVHTEFRSQAQRLLKGAERRGWKYFLSIASVAVEHCLTNSSQFQSSPSSLLFDHFVQNVTLRTVIIGLLDVDADSEELDESDIRGVATLITELWVLSKQKDVLPSKLFKLTNQLTLHIKHVFPNGLDGFPNPLDIIIPTWETMWRVVAITVAFSFEDLESQELFSRLVDCPGTEKFRETSTSSALSAEKIVNEVLRLYPPSKHIGRSVCSPLFYWMRPLERLLPAHLFEFLVNCVRRTDVADIYTALRDPEVCGQDGAQFLPLRPTQPGPLLAFGCGPLGCIARKWAPMAAGIMVASILDRISRDKVRIIKGPQIGGREGWNGWFVQKVENSSAD